MKFLLFLAFASFLFDASAQRMEDGVSYPSGNMEGSETLYSKKPARTLSQREFSQLYEREVIRPTVEQGGLLGGGIALNLQTGEISICKRAPEPSALSLMFVGGLAMLFINGRRCRVSSASSGWNLSHSGYIETDNKVSVDLRR
jgi:hypothetical protein